MVDADEPAGAFDFSAADHWFVIVCLGGEPVAVVETPSPGDVVCADLAEALFTRAGDGARWRRRLLEHMDRRMGAPAPARPERLAVSVVVCTHRRPAAQLRRLLDSARRLDPAPAEVIVVDNDPGRDDRRGLVAEYGFRYVPEERRGLDRARNAGIRAATGDVVAFTDDDVVLAPEWLGAVDECFADGTVGACTGPVFPLRLDTPARVRTERQASLSRGVRRRTVDWTQLSPVHAGSLGAGANLIVRRRLLGAGAFPLDLDAGTPSASGGDTYLLARLLGSGRRVVYEPRQWVWHDHRPDWAALRSALVGYGCGVSAVNLKLLVEDGELEAPRAWWWLVRQYRNAQVRRLRGAGDAAEVRLASYYLIGAVRGLWAWPAARRARLRAGDPAGGVVVAVPTPADPAPADPVAAVPGRVTAVVATAGRPAALRRCLVALAAQRGLGPGGLDVVVVDDAPVASVDTSALPDGVAVYLVRTGGAGAAAARDAGAEAATGDLLLFLDDDLVPAATLVAEHLAAHGRHHGEAMVIGRSPPAPRYPQSSFLAANAAALWWHDHFARIGGAARLTFTDALSGNMSIRRTTFQALGGFDPGFGVQRREDWEFGLRAARAGIPLAYAPAAVALHEYTLGSADRLRLARLEGHGDALLLRRFPEALASLRACELRHPSRRRAWAVRHSGPLLAATGRALPVLERLRLVGWWARLHGRAQRLAYARGLADAGWSPPAETGGQPIDLAGDAPLPDPGPAPPLLRPRVAGLELGELALADCGWHPRLWRTLARRLSWSRWREVGSQLEPRRAGGEPEAVADDLVVLAPSGRQAGPRQLAELSVALRGPRVAVAVGRIGAREWPAGALELRAAAHAPRLPAARPVIPYADLLVARRSLVDRAGRRPGEPAARTALRIVQAAFDAGDLVATRELSGDGMTVAAARRHEARARRATWRAWIGLLGARTVRRT